MPTTPSTCETAAASSRVSVLAVPEPSRVMPENVLPALIVSRFVPSDSIWVVMPAVAPWPTLTSATTAAVPMITPSIVSAERRRLVPSRLSARRMSSNEVHRAAPHW